MFPSIKGAPIRFVRLKTQLQIKAGNNIINHIDRQFHNNGNKPLKTL